MPTEWESPPFSKMLELSREDLACRLYAAGIIAEASLETWKALPGYKLADLRSAVDGTSLIATTMALTSGGNTTP